MHRQYRFVTALFMAFVFAAVFAFSGRAAPPALTINEILVGNAGTNLDGDLVNFSGWIEIHNSTGNKINLKKYKIESWPDGADTPDTYVINKGVVPANGYLLLWADETKKGNHLPFELDMDGGQLRLTAPNGDYDHVEFDYDQSMDVSIGRDSNGDWGYFFDQPTPAAANTTPAYAGNDDDDFAGAPEFSIEGGLYVDPLSVELTSATPGATIRYTTDGSRPTAASPTYGGPIAISETTVLRARAWADGRMVSPTVTQSYFFDIDANLPVLSLVIDDDYLFSPQIGIYAKGVNGILGCREKANWHRSWERPANFEFYELAGPSEIDQKINQEVGLEIFGNCTRNYPQKSFELKARKLYGNNEFKHPFFDDKPMTSYRRLILRNAGQDNNNAFMRDALSQNLSAGRMDIDRQAYRPIVVYLNGDYWGMYNLREKADEDYVENNYDLDDDEFDMLSLAARRITNGNLVAWKAFEALIKKNNVASASTYATINEEMDVNSFIDYIILETYVANTDWPRNNTRWWNDYDDDYRWRWLLQDLDASFMAKNLKLDMIRWTRRSVGATSLVFSKLIKNTEFQNEFAQRYAAHLNTTFQPDRVIGIIDDMADGIRSEVPAQAARWQRPASLAAWENEVQKLRSFAQDRPFYARETLRKTLPGKPGDAILSVSIDGDGRVLVAGAAVPDGYSGPHFKGIPIVMTAVPDSGQAFSHWVINGANVPDNPATLPFTATTTVTAYFDELPPPPPTPNLVINELHHTPASNDNLYEFLEIYNADDHTVDLSGYSLNGVDFTFPNGASIAAGEYIVVADTPASNIGSYQVFDFDGGLSNSGETIALIDAIDRVVDSVSYGVADPWPASPNAGGPSLSLLDPSLDNNNPVNWAASTEDGGTPGAENFPTP